MTTATLTTLPRLSPRAHGVGQSQSFSIQQPQRLPSLPQSNSIPPLKTPIPTFDQPGESLSSAAVKRLLQLCEELKRTADDKTREAEERARETEVVKREMRVMEAELAYRNDRIASAKARLAKEARAEEVASESHHLLHSELRRRVLAEQALSETRLFIADARQAREDAERARHEAQMAEQEARLGKERAEKVVEEWKEKMKDLEFETDDAKASAIKAERKIEELQVDVRNLSQQRDLLLTSESNLKRENGELIARVRDLLAENAKVTESYSITMEKLDETEEKLDESQLEVEDLKEQLQQANRHRATLKAELSHLATARAELSDRTRILDLQLARRTAELDEMTQRVQDTVHEYEQKLERKEEEVWAAKVAAGQAAAARLPMSASSARLGGQHGNMSAASVHASLSSGGSKPGTPQKPQSDGHTSSNEAASTEATPLDVSALPKPSSALSHHSIGSNPVASLRTSSAAQGENIRPSSAHRSSTAGRTSLAVVDPAALESAAAAMADMEARFAEKERAYASEVARLRQDVLGKGGEIAALSAQLSHIQSLLLDPRLNALSRIERELHDRLDAVALAEETLESLVRCPGCLGPVVPASESDGKDSGKRRGGKRKLGCGIPVTCVPCGHTYCATCASTFLEASLSGPRCELCAAAAPYQPTPPKGTPRPSVFSNPAYLSLAEHVGSRGNLVKGLGTWVAGLATTIEEVKRLRESLKGKSGSPTSTQLLDECELVSSIPEVTGVELDESAASEASGSQSN